MKLGRLILRWGRATRHDQPDWVYEYPDHAWNGRLLHALVQGDINFQTLVRELEERGFDTKTLRLSVRKKPQEEGAPTVKEE